MVTIRAFGRGTVEPDTLMVRTRHATRHTIKAFTVDPIATDRPRNQQRQQHSIQTYLTQH